MLNKGTDSNLSSAAGGKMSLAGRWMGERWALVPTAPNADGTRDRLGRPILLIPSWESPELIPKRSADP